MQSLLLRIIYPAVTLMPQGAGEAGRCADDIIFRSVREEVMQGFVYVDFKFLLSLQPIINLQRIPALRLLSVCAGSSELLSDE